MVSVSDAETKWKNFIKTKLIGINRHMLKNQDKFKFVKKEGEAPVPFSGINKLIDELTDALYKIFTRNTTPTKNFIVQ